MLLQMTGITKDFAAGRVLHGVDLQVEAGQVHALVGENGAGKSTMMKILGGLYPDHGGAIAIDSKRVVMDSPRASLAHGIAVIHQEFSLVPDLTVGENIALGREIRGALGLTYRRRATRRRLLSEVSQVGIDMDLAEPTLRLTVDKQQLVEIAKAIARNARVLVMDEPSARLTAGQRDQLFELIKRLTARGVGIIYISHFLEEIFAVAQDVTVLRDGRRVACMPLRDTSIEQLAGLMVGREAHALGVDSQVSAGRELPEDREVIASVKGLAVPGRLSATSIDIRRGEIFALAGLPTSGRSVVASALSGLESSVSGELAVRGRERRLPRSPREAAQLGIRLLPADRKQSGILSVRPVAENIVVSALGSSLSRGPFIRPRLRAQSVGQAVRQFSVRLNSTGQAITLLSGGNQQKVMLSRAVIAQPQLLILDQPTVGVDVGAKADIYERIDDLASDGLSVLLISDDLAEILRLAHSIAVVRGDTVLSPVPNSGLSRTQLLTAITSSTTLADGGHGRMAAEG